jgi:hypothetical protein
MLSRYLPIGGEEINPESSKKLKKRFLTYIYIYIYTSIKAVSIGLRLG